MNKPTHDLVAITSLIDFINGPDIDFMAFRDAAHTLAAIAKQAEKSLGDLVTNELEKQIYKFDRDGDHEFNAEAAEVLGIIGTLLALGILLRAARNETIMKWPIGFGIACSLGKFSTPEALGALFCIANDATLDTDVKHCANDALNRHIKSVSGSSAIYAAIGKGASSLAVPHYH